LALMLLTMSDCISYERLVTVFAILSFGSHLVTLYVSHKFLDLAFSTNPKLIGRVRDEPFVVTAN